MMSQPSNLPPVTAKVQLHVHLDGSPRLSSVLPLARKRGITLPVSTEEELRKAVVMTTPETLTSFLARFDYFLPAYIGCLDAVRQMAREFAEDSAADNVIYTEARYCPHLLIGDSSQLSSDQIVEAVNDEFSKAEKRLNIKLRSILVCMRHMPEIAIDIVRLCDKYRDQGVVAIDVAGDENAVENGHPTDQRIFDAFKLAKEKSIFRTVHAGENGSPVVVKEALDEMYADRIGHGYRTLDDEQLYQELLSARMHFECCPYSSIMTGAVGPDFSKHPIKRFAEDNFSFSLNTDDPLITGTNLSREFDIAETKIGITRTRLIQTIFDGAHNAFVPDNEKEELLAKLHSVYDPILPEAKNF